MNVVERAKALADELAVDAKCMETTDSRRDVAIARKLSRSHDSITDLLSIVERLPKDAIDALPKDYCRGCLYSLLRWNRKDGIECADCYDADDERPQSLDDHDYDAIVAVLDWAFAAAEAAREGE